MTRPKDRLIAAAVSEIARLGQVCGTHQSFRQQVSQIIVPLVEGLAQDPWRDALVACYTAHGGRYAGNLSPADMLEDLLRTVASAASREVRQQLGALAGLADQLVHTGLAIRAAQQPEDRNDVVLAYRDDSPRIAEDTIPAIDGWKIGCAVQSRYRGLGDHLDNEWRDVGLPGRPCTPNFMHPMMEYRVKPGELVSFCGGTPPVEYEPNPPLNWDEPG